MNNLSDDMNLINKYTRTPLKEEQVYVFTLTLCDNEVDRDFERFTKDALHKLCTLFEGKTGIFDHSMKSESQSARIFKTWVETDTSKKNSAGEAYCALRAKAYMVRTEKNKDLIDEIEGGIKKEVSIGCSVSNITCSICSKDMKSGECSHVKGRLYSKKQCCGILSEPYDAYEWSFVAVPSQRAAGITKSFSGASGEADALLTVKSAENGVFLSKSQLDELNEHIERLEQYKHDACAYKAQLLSDIEKSALLVLPKVNVKHFMQGLEGMPVQKLQSLRHGFAMQAQELVPPSVQLKPNKSNSKTDNNQFRI